MRENVNVDCYCCLIVTKRMSRFWHSGLAHRLISCVNGTKLVKVICSHSHIVQC